MKFTSEDIAQIENKGINIKKVEDQIEIFRRGNIPVNIEAAATIGNGIQKFTREEREKLSKYYDSKKGDFEILKFVPASGAATRMFKALHKFLDEFDPKKESLQDYLDRSKNQNLKDFFAGIERLPFYHQALNYAKECQPGFDSLTEEAKKFILVQTILFSPGLNLSNFPKGLVPFHNYGNFVATAFEEHLYEAAEYAAVNGVAKLHFTVSQGHKEKLISEFEKIKKRVQEKTHTKFEISYSYQDPKTDTIAVNRENEPFRTEEGKLFFRPGGHGALIENLNSLNADIVFIKNIDNVVVEEKAARVAEYKKMLAGKLLTVQEKCFSLLKILDAGAVSEGGIEDMKRYVEEELFSAFAPGFEQFSAEEKIQALKDRINRPLRVCGIVKNEGEPGGGPFLVNMKNGSKSLQIIEGAQIDQNNPQQKEIAKNATHFNPVDIVCGIKNYRGEHFNLLKFIDPSTSFIAEKTNNGKPLKALELPGLWNGGMAYWNTIFIEVPVETFNPVKTISDLLKPSHQPK